MQSLETRNELCDNDLIITTYFTVPITDDKYVITSSRFRHGAIDRLEWKWVTNIDDSRRTPSLSLDGDATSMKNATMPLKV